MMQPYHYAWLEGHPERTEEWLRDRIRDGFDVHHMDGDKTNNDPMNLALIEHIDHMRLHNLPLAARLVPIADVRRPAYIDHGQSCYRERTTGKSWREVEETVLGRTYDRYGTAKSMDFAKQWAKDNGQPWPIPL